MAAWNVENVHIILIKNKPVCSLVDYLISDRECLPLTSNMEVLEISEFSDHCPINFNFTCSKISDVNNQDNAYEKLFWDSSDLSQFYLLIREKEADFNLLSENFVSYGISTDEYISSFTKIVRDISFKCFGKNVKVPPNIKFTHSKKSE